MQSCCPPPPRLLMYGLPSVHSSSTVQYTAESEVHVAIMARLTGGALGGGEGGGGDGGGGVDGGGDGGGGVGGGEGGIGGGGAHNDELPANRMSPPPPVPLPEYFTQKRAVTKPSREGKKNCTAVLAW